MNGIAFRLSIVCYDRLFSRKCSLYRFERSDYFSEYHVDVFFLFLSICLMFLHLRVDCLIIENLETLESDGNCSTSFHFSLSLVILPRFNNTSVTELACRKVRCTGTVLDSQLVGTRFETVTGFQFGLNLAWEWRAPRYKLCSEFSFCRCLSDVNSTLHKV